MSVFDLLLLTACTVNVGAGRKDTMTNYTNVHFRLGEIINLDVPLLSMVGACIVDAGVLSILGNSLDSSPLLPADCRLCRVW